MAARSLNKKSMAIDLLPQSIQKRKRLRGLIFKLAAIQVAVFLCIGAVAVGLNALERQVWESSHDLNRDIYALRHGPAVAAVAYARDQSFRVAAEEAFVNASVPAIFDPLWLSAISDTCGGGMATFYYTGTAILVTGMSADISAVEIHRQSILDTGLFRAVDLGRVVLEDCGRYFYELWVRLY